MHKRSTLLTAGIAVCSLFSIARAQENPAVPKIALADETKINAVLLVGGFPHPFILGEGPEPGKPERGGFDVDWLVGYGTEAFAKIDGETSLSYTDFDGKEGAAAIVPAHGRQLFNFNALMTPPSFSIAYAIVDIEAAEAADTTCFFRSDDYAKVWLNGEKVHEVWEKHGRGTYEALDTFVAAFKPGVNRMVFKIEQKAGGWGMEVEIATAAGVAARKQRQIEREKTNRFRGNDLFLFDEEAMDTRGRMLPFIKGGLPGVVFQNPELAAEMADMDTFKVRWFNKDVEEITDAKTQVTEPGFYCAYVEITAKNGLVLRRVAPALFIENYEWWRGPGLFAMDKFPWHEGLYPPVSETPWNARDMLLHETLRMTWGHGGMFDAIPLFYAELALDNADAGAWRISPYANVHDYMARLRHKVLGRPAARELAPPVVDATATALRVGTEEEAGFKVGAVEAIRNAAQTWVDETGHGFVLAIARRGVVVMNEAFHGGKDAKETNPKQLTDGKLTVASRLPTASITKLHCGVLLGRCIDQGFLSLDDPVSKFFPDFPSEGGKAVTVRQLMNHTSGLEGHRWWMALEGMVNPFLDNVAWWDMQHATPGVNYNYNGFGIDLGAKIVEDITGRSAFDVIRDGLFAPLGQDTPTICDFGYGIDCTAMDLLRVAEMLRQEGAYDGRRYFSRETFKSLLPVPLALEEETKEEYGVGISWMRDWIDGTDREEFVLGKNVFGHGSATSAIMRVAPDLELVVGMSRYTSGPDSWKHTAKLMKAIADNLAE